MRPVATKEHSGWTAVEKTEEGGDDVKSSCPLRPGPHAYYNGANRGKQPREGKQIPKRRPSSDCRLQLACMKLELLVIANQNVAVNTFPGFVHTARQTMKVGKTRSQCPNRKEGAAEGRFDDWG